MSYAEPEIAWVEAEWAFHLHGRSAFLSRDDFHQLLQWATSGVPADVVVNAMEAYFQRRAKQARPRTYLALKHLEKDVAKAMKLREALARVEAPVATTEGWDRVPEPLHSDPKARGAYEAWKRLQVGAPAPDSPGFLDHFDQERSAQRAFAALAEAALGSRREGMEAQLRERLAEAGILEGGPVWKRAWDHHWIRLVCEAWGVAV